METTSVNIRIAGRKEAGYPTTHHVVTFEGDLDFFLAEVDRLVEETGYRKVDVYIDTPEEFNDDELETLEALDFII